MNRRDAIKALLVAPLVASTIARQAVANTHVVQTVPYTRSIPLELGSWEYTRLERVNDYLWAATLRYRTLICAQVDGESRQVVGARKINGVPCLELGLPKARLNELDCEVVAEACRKAAYDLIELRCV